MTNVNYYIFNTKVPMATKLGRMITYLDWPLPIKSHNPLITWPSKITQQTITIISALSELSW